MTTNDEIKTRIKTLLNIYEQVLLSETWSDLEDALDNQRSIIVLCLYDIVLSNIETIEYISKKEIQLGKIKNVHIPTLLLDTSKETLKNFSKDIKAYKRKVWVKRTNQLEKGTIYRTSDVSYHNDIHNMNTNMKCAKPLLHLTPEYLYNTVLTRLLAIQQNLSIYISRANLTYDVSADISDAIQDYTYRWNETAVMQIVGVSTQIDRTDGTCTCRFQTVSGKMLEYNFRKISHWILDGCLTHTYHRISNWLQQEQWARCLKSPAAWVTLENYEMFNSTYTHVELVDQQLIDSTEEVKALVIYYGDAHIHEGTFVFFKKEGTEYRTLNSNHKVAKRLLKHMELMKQLVT